MGTGILGRKMTIVTTIGFRALNVPDRIVAHLLSNTVGRYNKSEHDYFSCYEPAQDYILYGDGNNNLHKYKKEELKGITEKVFVIVDDYGKDSEEGLVITLLLAEEY